MAALCAQLDGGLTTKCAGSGFLSHRISDLFFLAKLVKRTQHIMKPASYLMEHRLADSPFDVVALADSYLRLA